MSDTSGNLRSLVEVVMVPHCYHDEKEDLWYDGSERMAIHGVDVVWPLAPAQAASLLEASPDKATLFLPPSAISSSLYLDHKKYSRNNTVYGLKPSAGHVYDFAHFAIDAVGSASALVPTPASTPGTFATLLYFVPSDCIGGAVTITYEDQTTTYEARGGHSVVFFNTCHVSVAPITWGTRGIFVHRVSYEDYASRYMYGLRLVPPPLPSKADIDDAIEMLVDQEYCVVHVELETRTTAPQYATLTGRDKAVVEWLLAAEIFDMAFITVNDATTSHRWIPPTGTTDGRWVKNDGSDRGKTMRKLPDVFHPQCVTPSRLQTAWPFRPIAYFIEEDTIDIADDDASDIADDDASDSDDDDASDSDDEDNRPVPVCLVFWPKALRLSLLGLVRTVALLRDHVDGSCSDDFGFGSTQALFEAAVRFFTGAEPGPAQLNRSSRLAMANVLFDYGDRALMADYLSGMRWDEHDVAIVPWVVSVVRRFGLPAMTDAFSRLDVQTSGSFWRKVLEGIRADTPSCERDVYEMASRWWTSALKWNGMPVDGIQLAGWLYENNLAPSTRALLSARLPADVVDNIVVMTIDVAPLVQRFKYERGLPVALWSLRATPLPRPLHDAYLDYALQLHKSDVDYYDEAAACLLLLTIGTCRFEAADAIASTRRTNATFQQTLGKLRKQGPLTAAQELILDDYLQSK
ncbi:hypothetical protein SPRG_02781 [Saprolegnia parasitica CBS 223.65]|uniref:Uncharacterized protein n=1 Tax=Saprolegnia parasitica (strain CBS 223.65) TaxID=695850 RepID=A0A067CZS9_SAPPC|nr:hypothetical protein SPRG_02781 [Saprolegnia parasitica CBS 223.65]KDO32302.1 hypothetical protein SPRG_02781 [Saprolegnia parasitica CBS 223.65]|eukprot:XP_012196758.1 hypothetical protein SPRG_02781 [Saprolegnia parasitica CBS 223.65]